MAEDSAAKQKPGLEFAMEAVRCMTLCLASGKDPKGVLRGNFKILAACGRSFLATRHAEAVADLTAQLERIGAGEEEPPK
ncbi:MAG: hypothetical protein IKX21_04780 [Deltaproteobacteria bacterium]|nr:hypothetical protein [Deltaproteobacteria bacterium]